MLVGQSISTRYPPGHPRERQTDALTTHPFHALMATPCRRHRSPAPTRRPPPPPPHAAPPPPATTTPSGIYTSSGAGCQGSGTSADCLSWGLRVPSTITPKKDLTVTIEADSAPGRWAWNCLASDRIAGTAAFYDSPSNKLSESSLKSSAKLHYGVYGDSAGQVEAVTCTPEHLSITYKIDHLVRSGGSYLDLSFGTTTTTPGSGEYTYSFSPTVTTSADNTPQKITATVKKPAENAVPR